MFNGRRHLRKRSAAGILCGSLLLTVISATVLGKTTTVVYASDIEKYTNADFAMDTVVSETLYTSGEDINTQIGEKLREMETTLLSWTEENSQISHTPAAATEKRKQHKSVRRRGISTPFIKKAVSR